MYSRIGGGTLQAHWEDELRTNVRDELETGSYDLFIMNGRSGSEAGFDTYAGLLEDLATSNGARTLLLSSWPADNRISLSDPNTEVEADEVAHRSAAESHGTGYIPVNLAYRELYLALADRYNDTENGAIVEEILTADNGHGSHLGNYLTATMLYASIFEERPPALWIPPDVSGADATLVRNIAWSITRDFAIPIDGNGPPPPPPNEDPELTSPTSFSIAENSIAVGVIAATDADGDDLSYTIAGGADAAVFEIDETSGALRFATSPDFETPGDAGGDNVYNLNVSVSDGEGGSDAASVSVSVTDVNEQGGNTDPVFVSPTSFSVAENSTAVGAIAATDADGDDLGYTIAGGADAALFEIDETSGALRFAAAPDFEAPGDSGADNVYDVDVSVSDGQGGSAGASLQISVSDVNEGGTGEPGPGVDYSTYNAIEAAGYTRGTAGADVFEFNAVRGDVAFAGGAGLDAYLFNAFSDGNVHRVREIEAGEILDVSPLVEYTGGPVSDYVRIDASNASRPMLEVDTDGAAGGASFARLALVVGLDADDAQQMYDAGLLIIDGENDGGDPAPNTDPVFVSPTSFSVAENSTAVGAIAATDADGDDLGYTIAGGADAALFEIDETSGALRFAAAPDFEAPGDSGADNVYDVDVSVSDGQGGSAGASLQISVSDVNEGGTGEPGPGVDYSTYNAIEAAGYTRGTAGADVFEFNAVRGDVAFAGGAGLDAYLFNAFSDGNVHRVREIEAGEILDVSPLVEYTGGPVSDYVRIDASNASRPMLEVDTDGAAGGASFARLALVVGLDADDAQQMYDAGLLIV
ncbi:Ig-like domain-containing protein [Gymnodinialimonas ulvae]|uniref:Ig-like domain-containing protein n=1 Tax=Gymnodinialimonas ulvae TaxID=3126504 RepID=UPI0030ECD24F